ncbi:MULTISPECIES: DUF2877 domain-containing protein [unclassified Streptomyces]|uniref:oxamate carbamoyltransferase subunit AllH family protein n=1 Tax=unclassified Streptomyces TaxID=2593676 RepID=UPI000DBA1954|nr:MULTISPECIES: DUF2877 domain-containing protein [unclassified Streptomyces]MYT74874.1 DUF2877 domain-containing protein [Streptomyces sp. SID8367]RAJ91861.1 uncharacterized protein DUF2877 [Streptomyces sp. PsTaAH-137]
MHGDESARTCTVFGLSGDAELLDLLCATTGEGRIHSVFTRVVNLLTPDGLLVTLAARDGGDAPRTLVVDTPDWTATALTAGRPVTFAPGNILLAPGPRPLRVTSADARSWRPKAPSLTGFAPGTLARVSAQLDALNQEFGPRGGMLGPVPGAGPLELAVARALDAGRATLLTALRHGEGDAAIRRGVLALLGLGPGLTPAGDDFLTGLTFVAALPGAAPTGLVPAVRAVLAEHRGRTTDVSHATLTEATRARVRAELIHVLRQSAEEDRPPHAPVRRLLAIGHTSGSDTLSGLVAGLHLEEELRGSL